MYLMEESVKKTTLVMASDATSYTSITIVIFLFKMQENPSSNL